MLAGEFGPAQQAAMEQLLQVGRFFDAEDLVEVAQVHLMADGEALGKTGIEFLEELASDRRARVRIPTITDPRGTDFAAYRRLRQDRAHVDLERRAIAAFEKLGLLLTNTCINYQVIQPPTFGQHIAYGDTGSSIFANSVCGARTNFEGGPAALAAALTGRVPRYGFHLDEVRRGDSLFLIRDQPRDLVEWGALGALIGRYMRSYFETPVIDGIATCPTSDELKHFGAALASFGSTPLFHMVGVTPEALRFGDVFVESAPKPPVVIDRAAMAAFNESYRPTDGHVDVVVFAAPQLSLIELRSLADLLHGRRVSDSVTLIAAVPPQVKTDADRLGLTRTIEDAGGLILEGVCFYQMRAREMAEANGWKRLMSNSVKLINILGGYGYEPFLGTMEECVEAAIQGCAP